MRKVIFPAAVQQFFIQATPSPQRTQEQIKTKKGPLTFVHLALVLAALGPPVLEPHLRTTKATRLSLSAMGQCVPIKWPIRSARPGHAPAAAPPSRGVPEPQPPAPLPVSPPAGRGEGAKGVSVAEDYPIAFRQSTVEADSLPTPSTPAPSPTGSGK